MIANDNLLTQCLLPVLVQCDCELVVQQSFLHMLGDKGCGAVSVSHEDENCQRVCCEMRCNRRLKKLLDITL